MKKRVCGIDFGTSNSAIAVTEGDAPSLVKVEEDSDTLPTSIFFPAIRDASPIFGRAAINSFTNGDPGRLMRSLKRVLGTSLMRHATRVNDGAVLIENVIKMFVQNLKDKLDENSDVPVEDVVMGRPVHFIDNDPDGDAQAQLELDRIARHVGFKNVEFQYEPIAAAFAHEVNIDKESLAIVIDIGGGTSDFTIMKLSKDYINKSDRRGDILGNTGVRVGGNDFDKDLSIKSFMPVLGMGTTYGEKYLDVSTKFYFDLSTWSSVNSLYNYKTINSLKTVRYLSHDRPKIDRLMKVIETQTGHLLLAKVEDTKIDLTAKDKHIQELAFIEPGLNVEVNRNEFEAAISREVEKIDTSILQCLSMSGVKNEDIDLVILTGGSTEIPLIKLRAQNNFPRAKISEENKLSSVAIGLAYDSLRKFGSPK